MLLSRVVDDNNIRALKQYGIDEQHFATQTEREAYRFIIDYADENGQQTPSYAAVTDAVPDFMYLDDITDRYEYLAKKLKQNYAINEYKRKFSGTPEQIAKQKPSEFAEVFSRNDPEEIGKYLRNLADDITMRTSVRNNPGKTFAEIKESVRNEFDKRRDGKSFTVWKTPFPTFNEIIGGLYSGDIYGIMAESGRGKTYLLEMFIDELLRQGANVAIKSYEVKEYDWIARLISIISAREGLFNFSEVSEEQRTEFEGRFGIPVRAILSGKMESHIRENFEGILDNLDNYYEGNVFLQAKGGKDLTRTLDGLERELEGGGIDVVVLDPFYGLTDVYGKNANKTSGGAAEQAATRFEQIIGDHNVVGMYTVQATVEKKSKDEEGDRELNPPTRDQVKTSKRLLDIATVLLSFDSVKAPDEVGGQAVINIEKGRNGGEDLEIELISILDYGILKEMDTGEKAMAQFDF